ncbi:hypothetical protein QVO10_17045 [Bacteroides gallinaceum]|uniref:Transposase n=2 Tax=Bacteroidaceae TaxID=815 RepID=A0ABT7XAE6_9BACE|nr:MULTISPECIES: hypothetical protein [Bacteroidaceae]MBD8039448.1 hypothetical protein [Phocaeicola intestinalis]MDN0051054.1 hypothetical protein [Bacteroides gallinaceum]
MIWDEFLRHFRFCDEEDSGLSDEEQERKGPKNRPKHTRKQIHQAKKNFLEKFKTASKTQTRNISCKGAFLLSMKKHTAVQKLYDRIQIRLYLPIGQTNALQVMNVRNKPIRLS